jgi:hypothetical protein
MLGEKKCPFCAADSSKQCRHLALATEARNFVRRSVELCQGEPQWQRLCDTRRAHLRLTGDWAPEREDFMWLETAFSNQFLKRLIWFGFMDYEWRTGPRAGQGGFWVLLWSKEPRRLWWELRDEFERQGNRVALDPKPAPSTPGPWLFAPGA